MGIQGLIGLDVVESATTDINVRQLSGSVCVIDGYGWLHRASYGCAEQLYTGQHTDQYVLYCLKRCQYLIEAGIKPIVVFDGQRLPAKELIHNNRHSVRHNVRQKIELLLSEGNDSKAKELMRSCVEVTPRMAKNLMNGLREKSIDFIVAPFEADAQMAYLVNNGFADFVVTEDSDLLVYNCRLCLFKLDSNGNGRLVDMTSIRRSFDENKFRHMAILSGCDYLPNLPGIGLKKAKKFFKMTANTDLKKVLFKVPNYLKMSKRVKVTQEYVDNFIKADNTFKYQLVVCPQKRKLVPLTPYDNEVKVNELSYAGKYFSDGLGQDFEFQYAIGNVDPKSLEIIDSYSFEPKSNSIWSKDWFNYKKKFTSNRIVLQKLSSNNVMTVSHNYSTNRSQNTNCLQRIERNCSETEDISNKRLKVNENRFVNSSQLMKEYLGFGAKVHTSDPMKSSTKMSSVSNKSIYSRNIFKVEKQSNTDERIRTVQSKYFTEIKSQKSSSEELSHYKKQMKSKVICEQNSLNVSQCSLNSSGNTINESLLDDTLTLSDTERSEVSETSDEEVIEFNRYTHLKHERNGSIKRLALFNSTFIDSNNESQISSYFK